MRAVADADSRRTCAIEAEMWRGQLLDRLSLYSDELTEHLLAEKPPPADLVRKVIRDATLHGLMVPVLCGSALDGIGVQPVLDAVALSAQPGRCAAGRRRRSQGQEDNPASPASPRDEPFCSGLVFKIQADRHGDLHYIRVYSGELKAGSRVLNAGQREEGKRAAAPAHSGRSPRAGRDAWGWATSSASSA